MNIHASPIGRETCDVILTRFEIKSPQNLPVSNMATFPNKYVQKSNPNDLQDFN